MRRAAQYDSKPLLGVATLATLQQSANRLCLCSCRGNALAGETGEGALGAFAHRLLIGLCGPAAESAIGSVTLTKLHAYLFNHLSEQHRPQLFGQQTSPFILVGEPVPATSSNAQLSSSPSQNGSPVGQGGMKTPGPSKSGLLKMYTLASSSASMSASASRAASAPTDSGQAPSSSGVLQKAVPDEQSQKQYEQILEQARQSMQTQNYKEAFDLVEQVLQNVPNDVAALTLKGQLLGTAGRLAEATTTVEQLLQHDPNNALAWSMRAVLLSNMGQQQAALSAIDRSLEIDPNNPESYGIKTRIMESVATARTPNDEQVVKPNVSQKQVPYGASPVATKDNPRAFFIEAGLQILVFILGIVGAVSTYFLNQTVPYVSLAIACLGLATMCVIATRGAFLYGFSRLVPTVLVTIVSAVILGGAYAVLGLTRIIANIQAQTQITPQAAMVRLFAFSFIGIWLAAAAILPFLGAIIGTITGFIVRASNRGR